MKHITERAFIELSKAHVIIQSMLSMLTDVQRIEWLMKSDSYGLIGANGSSTREGERNALFDEFKSTPPVTQLNAPARDVDLETLVSWSMEAMNQGFDARLVNMVVRQAIEDTEISPPRQTCRTVQFPCVKGA